MSQKFPVNNLERIKDASHFNEDFIKNYNESDEVCFLQVDIKANLHDKTECVMLIKNLKQALNNGLVLKKVHRVIKFN